MYPKKEVVKLSLEALFSNTLGYFDFQISGLASSYVWPLTFFSSYPYSLSLLYSFLAFSTGLITRPLGGIIYGVLGDKEGRKTSLYFTLLAMSIGTTGIALIPPSLGIIGISLLFIFRAMQGIALGGQWGGASILLIEHFHESSKRASVSNLSSIGVPLSLLFSSLTFYLMSGSPSFFLSLGWRIIFITSGTLTLLLSFLSSRILDSPLFEEIRGKGEISRSPLKEALKGEWKKILALMLARNYITSLYYISTTFIITFLYSIGVPLSVSFSSLVFSSIAMILSQLVGSYLADIVGRKKVILFSSLSTSIMSIPYIFLISSGNHLLIYLSQSFFCSSLMFGYGAISAYIAENFPTKYRLTASNFTYQFSTPLSAIPQIIAPYLLYSRSPEISIALMLSAISLTSFISCSFTEDTYGRGLNR